jgi:hypothetical protein
MSDFSTFNDFRKGYKLGKNNQYSDPTYLSFSLMFDFTNKSSSPLLSGAARAFIKQNTDADGKEAPIQSHAEYSTGYGHRLKALDDFILTLKKINQEMPWYWQSLAGIDLLQKYDPLKGYRGGDESKITIGTLESLDLTIAGLMHLYRTACFDEERWSYILPANLRKFRIWIYVTEVRPIKNLSKIAASLGFDKDGAKDAIKGNGKVGDVFNPSFGVSNANAGISGTDSRPFFLFELGSCEWDMTLGTAQFADLQKSPEGFAASEIGFTYEKVGKVSARVLNGTLIEAGNDTARMSPANAEESKAYDPNDFKGLIGDKIKDKLGEMGDRVVDDAALFMEKKKQQVGQLGSNLVRANVPNFENIYTNMVADADAATDVTALSDNMPENVFGIMPGSTVKDGFDQSATAGLNIGENVNQDSNTTNSGTDGDNNLGNVNE